MSVQKSSKIHRINKDDLMFLLNVSVFDMMQKLNRSDFGFFVYLQKQSYRKNDDEVQILEMVVKILSQVCSLNDRRNVARLNRLLRMLKDCQEFLYNDVPRVINCCFIRNDGINLVTFMAHYMIILKTLLCKEFFPCERIISEIFPALENYMNRLREKKFKNVTFTEECFLELSRKIESYENPAASDEEDDEISNFRHLSVVPRSNDIVNYEISQVPQNIIDRPYKSVDHYLSTYYRLTREDMLRSFRECVNKCISTSGKGISSSDKDRYYENVSVISSPKYTTLGVCYKIMVRHSKEIDWSQKEVLLPGSLVFLTPDSFSTVIFATVKENPKVSYNMSKECKLTIKLEDDLFLDNLSEGAEYAMIEPAAYFECYKHILSAIKDFNEGNFPLADVISYFEYEDLVPKYLGNTQYCLHEKCENDAENEKDHPCKRFDPLQDDDWPEIDSSKLDNKQYLAFKTALTKKVSLIQGPPGTGKTHVGRKIVKTLLENISHKPIVICCLTNHALDHFLEGLLKENITKKIVRLGGQSKSKTLEPYFLQTLRYTVRQYHQEGKIDKSLQKSFDLLKDVNSKALNDKMLPVLDPEVLEVKLLCDEINADVLCLSLCKDKYLDENALNDIIDSKYKEKLRNTPGSLKKSLSCSVLEWLVCSHKSDLYDKCRKKFLEFENRSIEEPTFKNIWELYERKRFELFYCWRKRCIEILKSKLEENLELYKRLMRLRSYKTLDIESALILKDFSVIGVTTTGASKYRDLLKFVEPKIIIIEEAAQVLESHVIASLVPSIQHLILIGDHEQLRPLPTNYDLSEKYNLKISLFERLFLNKAPSATLVCQHRMKPCIAELLVPKPYADYTSSNEVYNYEEIKGVQSSVFFFSHDYKEDSNSFGNSSSNDFEAQMIACLAKYFFVLNYQLKDITILATYAAQVVLIRSYLSEKNLTDINVTTVDNFQGEENDIILLSFVRSNFTTIGFLKESNRVCVALSRAKKGLFCFGNFELFASRNNFWKDIVDKARSKSMLGNFISLKCEVHQTILSVKCGEDILKFLINGCSEMCNFILPCNHKCEHTCHFNDRDHLHYICKQPCERMIDENRVCRDLCYERCKKIRKKKIELPCGHFGHANNSMCLKEVQRLLPCGHIPTIPCHMDILGYKCKAAIKKDLKCGHSKMICCHDQHEDISIICTELRPETGACGHTVNVPCYLHLDDNVAFCNKACGALLDCGHPCVRSCRFCFYSGIHGFCTENCEYILTCGHKCWGYCNSPCPPCNKKCFLSCLHGTQCINDCLRPCVTCKNPCARVCSHEKKRCSKKCYETCNLKPCMEPCTERLSCGHSCIGLCGDPCPYLCRECNADDLNTGDAANSLYVELECGHVIEVNELTEHVENCLVSLEWPCCPVCSQVIIKILRYKESLMEAKKVCIESFDTSETISEIHYLVDSMYGEDRIVPAAFQDIDKRIKNILEKENPLSDSLLVLKNCIILLKKLVNEHKYLRCCDKHIGDMFTSLISWIFNHLTCASFQQLKELESAVSLLTTHLERNFMDS